jgi:hypothetical protein
MFEKDEAKSASFKGKYLGGHSAFPKAKSISLVVSEKSLEIPEMSIMIPFNRLENAQLVKEEKLASSLILLPWRKIKRFVMLTFIDENDYEESLFIDVEKAEEANDMIHRIKSGDSV